MYQRGRKLVESGGAQNFGHEYETIFIIIHDKDAKTPQWGKKFTTKIVGVQCIPCKKSGGALAPLAPPAPTLLCMHAKKSVASAMI